MTRDVITIRLAQPGEGPLIGQLFTTYGGPTWDWVDWSHAHLNWLIGEVNGEPKGVIMVNPGVPFGRSEFLTVDPSLPHATKARLCRDLGFAGVESCRHLGSQAVFSNIDQSDASWKAIAAHRGWNETGTGSYMMKRCS